MRRALKLSTEEIAKRSRGMLDRRVVERIEKGEAKLQSVRQREGLAVAYGLSLSEIQAIIDGQLTIETAIAIASGKTPEVASPDRAPAEVRHRLGERMGTAIQLREADLARFPNLEFCIEYHRRNRKTWDASVIAAARAGQFGESDFGTTGEWESALDRLQAVMRHAREARGESTRTKT